MTPLEMIAEWRKGCTCGGPVHDQCFPDAAPTSPAQCQECTVALIDALERKLQPDAEDPDQFIVSPGALPLKRLYVPVVTSVTLGFPNEFAERPEQTIGREVKINSGDGAGLYIVDAVDGETLLLRPVIDAALEEG